MNKIELFIIEQIKEKKFVITTHARIRMSERFFTDADIINIAMTTTSIVRQDENNTYLLSGKNIWDEKASLSVALRKEIIIVTIFYKE